jgi:hypothetical protein
MIAALASVTIDDIYWTVLLSEHDNYDHWSSLYIALNVYCDSR